MAAPAPSSFNLRSILEKEKLTGTNIMDWYRNLRIVLRQEHKEFVLTQPFPADLPNNAPAAQRREHEKRCNDYLDISCLMLATMSPELQRQYEALDAHTIITGLRNMFEDQARAKRFNTSKSLFACRLAEGNPVSPHVIKMIGYNETLEKLGFPLSQELATDLILQSLPPSFEPFILNFNMNNMNRTLTKLPGMLKTAEESIKKNSNHVMVMHKRKPNNKKSGPAKDAECFFCKEAGHWKRNCKKYLEQLKQKQQDGKSSTSGINVIEINLATSSTDSWVFDTGSVAHICKSLQGLKRSRSLARGEVDIRVGNGARVAAVAVGTMPLSLPSRLVLELNNYYCIPALCKNVISASCLQAEGYGFRSVDNDCSVYYNDIFYFHAPMMSGLYIVNLNGYSVYNINAKRQRPNDLNPTFIWHCRLGHINEKRMEKIHRDGLLHSFDFESFETCESCLLGKMTKAPFTGQSERASELLALVHTDVCGPMSSTARGGFGYFFTFTDDFSRYGYVYLMRHKSESFEKFKEFHNEVQNHLGKTIKYLRSDRGGEYLSLEFGNHLKECGIVPQLTPPGTPQWNGVSEWRNRTLLDMVRSMMSQTNLLLSFWGYALETTAFTLNSVPSKSVDKTPYEIWTGKRPSLSFLKIWGCEVYVKRLQSDKLTPKSDKCFFVGYPKETKGYYFYNQEEGKVFVARHGVFLEKEFISRKDIGSMLWKHRFREDPKKKTDVDGNVHIYKARLVAKGFRQIQGVDYDETFSPVAMLKFIWIVLAIAAYFDYEIWQMYVKTAFLNGNLDEDVYMTQPKGFDDPQSAKKICKLHQSIYGLKQASRSWNIRFDEVVKALGFVRNEEEPCVYKKISGSALVFLILYVDDILLIGNDISMLESVKTSLKNSFSMKDLGEAAYILGIRIYRDRSKRLIGLSQSTYIDKVLKRFNMQDSKKGFLPMSHGINLGKNQCPQTTDERNKMSVIPYASAIGSIMYAMLCTRPDVSYALSATSRYQSDPGESHWIAVKNILKYLRRTKDMFLAYGGQEELVVNGYTDASFQIDKDDFRSQSGFVFCLNGGAVSWKSSKQDIVVDSTTEAEYIAASEAVWIKKFVSQLGVMTSASSSMDLYCDNSGAIAQAKEPRSHQKSKHILRQYHLIREIVGRGDVKICKIHTDLNVADPLTKPLPQPKHEAHTRAMGIRYIHD
uniref:Integrase core domain, putative n=2 Tax=Oryza sativa subsp. japonica TaxID=39947 RepID=A0A5S6R8S8_ORYSJ|nr:Integrase core domain, putative [Oryza sativa Japonica Group]AAX92956.1 retrotransposon protein, putative, Ty1-copia sub-class [Oryza sativa Japonica Group]ABA92827.2 retrotransposon protein, putative, Ty1-copia subclass [Oryza sativa Japonica Group]